MISGRQHRQRRTLAHAWVVVRPVLFDVWPAWLLLSVLVLHGFHWGLPSHYEANSWEEDENGAVSSVLNMGFPRFEPTWLGWGTWMFTETYVVKELVTLAGVFPADFRRVLILGRVVVFLSGLAGVTAVYVLSRDLFGRTAGRISAVLLAVTPGFVYAAHFFKVEVAMIVWLVLALWAAQRVAAGGGFRYVVAAGLLAGIAASTQYDAGAIVPAGLVAIWMAGFTSRGRAYVTYLGCVAAAFLVGTPYALLNPRLLAHGLRQDADLSRVGIAYTPARLPAVIDYPFYVLRFTLSAPLLIVAVVGAVVALFRERTRLLPVWTFVATFLFLLSFDNLRMVRPTLPLAAVCTVFAGYVLALAIRIRPFRVVAALAAVAVACFAFLFAFSVVRNFARTDPRVEAEIWLTQHVPPHTRIATTGRASTTGQLALIGYRPIDVQRSRPNLARVDTRYLMLSDITLLPWLEALSYYPDVRSFTTYVADHYCVVATFEHSQKLPGINSKPRTTYVPFDWLQVNPRITILERKSPQRQCRTPAPTTAQATGRVVHA